MIFIKQATRFATCVFLFLFELVSKTEFRREREREKNKQEEAIREANEHPFRIEA
jgi:hypothetical protein